jgi:hypothetical protein
MDELRALQAPLKKQYREQPETVRTLDCRFPRPCGPAPHSSLVNRVPRLLFESTSDSRDFVMISEAIEHAVLHLEKTQGREAL